MHGFFFLFLLVIWNQFLEDTEYGLHSELVFFFLPSSFESLTIKVNHAFSYSHYFQFKGFLKGFGNIYHFWPSCPVLFYIVLAKYTTENE